LFVFFSLSPASSSTALRLDCFLLALLDLFPPAPIMSLFPKICSSVLFSPHTRKYPEQAFFPPPSISTFSLSFLALPLSKPFPASRPILRLKTSRLHFQQECESFFSLNNPLPKFPFTRVLSLLFLWQSPLRARLVLSPVRWHLEGRILFLSLAL